MFESFDELLDYIRSNKTDISVSYDLYSKHLMVINNNTDQILFNQNLNYQIGEFKTAIEPLFTNLDCSVEYINGDFN